MLFKLFAAISIVATAFQSVVGRIVPGSYIVKCDKGDFRFPEGVAVRTFYPHIRAYEVEAGPASIEKLARESGVQYVEANQVFEASHETQQNAPSWGLARISQERFESLDYTYPTSAGKGVDVFVIDTGIWDTHPDFGGKAKQLFVAPGMGDNVDCNGHGTHVAGTVAGLTTGVAKKTGVVGIKVLNCAGAGTTTSVLNGIEYVLRQTSAKTTIINMSLGGGRSMAIDDIIAASANSTLFVVAAGNSNSDACNDSPAGSPMALTVAASDILDRKAIFSSHGPCVDIVAPGVDITAPFIPEGFRVLSGTSMASPHVAGIAAVVLAQNPDLDAQALRQAIVALGTQGVLSGFDSQTPALLSRVP